MFIEEQHTFAHSRRCQFRLQWDFLALEVSDPYLLFVDLQTRSTQIEVTTGNGAVIQDDNILFTVDSNTVFNSLLKNTYWLQMYANIDDTPSLIFEGILDVSDDDKVQQQTAEFVLSLDQETYLLTKYEEIAVQGGVQDDINSIVETITGIEPASEDDIKSGIEEKKYLTPRGTMTVWSERKTVQAIATQDIDCSQRAQFVELNEDGTFKLAVNHAHGVVFESLLEGQTGVVVFPAIKVNIPDLTIGQLYGLEPSDNTVVEWDDESETMLPLGLGVSETELYFWPVWFFRKIVTLSPELPLWCDDGGAVTTLGALLPIFCDDAFTSEIDDVPDILWCDDSITNTIIPPPSTGTSNISKTIITTGWGGNFGQNEVLWWDGVNESSARFYNNYWVNIGDPPPPDNYVPKDFPIFTNMVDYWKGIGGDTVSLPVHWDRCHYQNRYDFRVIVFALQYAQARGMKVNLWVKCNRRWVGSNSADAEKFNTTNEFTFRSDECEISSDGKLIGGLFDQMPALSNEASRAWNNWYNYVTALAQACLPYANTIGYWTAVSTPTLEWGLLYENGEDGSFHPDTRLGWALWWLNNVSLNGGTWEGAVPSMAKREEADSVIKRRTAKFHSWRMNQILANFATRVKNVNNAWKVIHHGSSYLWQTFRRTHVTSVAGMPSIIDGWKHNPPRFGHKEMYARAVAQEDPNRVGCIEWTNSEGIGAEEMADNIRRSIDAGVTSISFSFFIPDTQQSDALLRTCVQSLKNTGHWTKNHQKPSLSGNPDIIFMGANEAMSAGNNIDTGDYQGYYTNAFNTSMANYGGIAPRIVFIDNVSMNDVTT